jgi:hypothetical protein
VAALPQPTLEVVILPFVALSTLSLFCTFALYRLSHLVALPHRVALSHFRTLLLFPILSFSRTLPLCSRFIAVTLFDSVALSLLIFNLLPRLLFPNPSFTFVIWEARRFQYFAAFLEAFGT